MSLYWRNRAAGIRYEAAVKLFSLYCQWTPPSGCPKSGAVIPFGSAGYEPELSTHNNCVSGIKTCEAGESVVMWVPPKGKCVMRWSNLRLRLCGVLLCQTLYKPCSTISRKSTTRVQQIPVLITRRRNIIASTGVPSIIFMSGLKSCDDHMQSREAVKQLISCFQQTTVCFTVTCCQRNY